MRLGIGEYEIKNSERPSVEEARLRFLHKAGSVEPRVLNRLKEDVFPIFADLKKRLDLSNGIYWETIQDAKALFEALISWSQEFNLNAVWCRELAIVALKGLSKSDDETFSFNDADSEEFREYLCNLVERNETPLAVSSGSNISRPIIDPSIEPWYPLVETREDYLKRIVLRAELAIREHPLLERPTLSHRRGYIKLIKTAVEEYCDKVEEYFDLIPVVVRNSEYVDFDRDLEWAAQHQVFKWGWTKIAKENSLGFNPSTIKRAVEYLLEFIGLPSVEALRTGRGKGVKDGLTSDRRK
jgi:hypothetical protein